MQTRIVYHIVKHLTVHVSNILGRGWLYVGTNSFNTSEERSQLTKLALAYQPSYIHFLSMCAIVVCFSFSFQASPTLRSIVGRFSFIPSHLINSFLYFFFTLIDRNQTMPNTMVPVAFHAGTIYVMQQLRRLS